MGQYIIKQRYNKKENRYEYAIFYIDDNGNEKQISKWWNDIYSYGLVNGESEYYIVKNDKDEQAIFHKDDPEHPISEWWEKIYSNGLVKGESDYYMAQNDDNKKAIFHKDDPEHPISDWWNFIYEYGLIKGQSEYYIAKRDNDDKWAIFHKDDPEHPISEWWKKIFFNGLIRGESEYYIVKSEKNKFLIFHKNNKNFFIFISNDEEEAKNILDKIKNLSPLEVFFKYNKLC